MIEISWDSDYESHEISIRNKPLNYHIPPSLSDLEIKLYRLIRQRFYPVLL